MRSSHILVWFCGCTATIAVRTAVQMGTVVLCFTDHILCGGTEPQRGPDLNKKIYREGVIGMLACQPSLWNGDASHRPAVGCHKHMLQIVPLAIWNNNHCPLKAAINPLKFQ